MPETRLDLQDKTVLYQTIDHQPELPGHRHFLYSLLSRRSFWVKAIWAVFLLSGLSYQTYLAYHYSSNETTNSALFVGRIAAYNLLILLVLLWIPVMRHTSTWLRQVGAENWLPLDSFKTVHRWLGHVLLGAALIHGASYLFYFDSLEGDFLPIYIGQKADLVRSMETTMYEFVTEDESIEDVSRWIAGGWDRQVYQESISKIMKEDCTKCHSADSTMTYAAPQLALTDYESVKSLSKSGGYSRQFRINMTGTLMLILFSIVWVTSLGVMRKRYYHRFQSVHRLGYVLAVLALFHIPRFEYCVYPAIILFVEYILNRKNMSWYGCKTKIKMVGESVFSLDIKLPKSVFIRTGHYVQIRVRSISNKEWHSISLINGGENSDTLNLMIKVLGDWTEQLYLISKVSQEVELDVRGFYASPIASAAQAKQVFCVAGGIGVTPVMSLINHYQQQVEKWEKLTVVWVFRDWALLNETGDWLRAIQEKSPEVNLLCFATSPCPEKFQIPRGVEVFNRRPCLSSKMAQFETNESALKHVFVCGPESLSAEIKSLVFNRKGWQVIVEHF